MRKRGETKPPITKTPRHRCYYCGKLFNLERVFAHQKRCKESKKDPQVILPWWVY